MSQFSISEATLAKLSKAELAQLVSLLANGADQPKVEVKSIEAKPQKAVKKSKAVVEAKPQTRTEAVAQWTVDNNMTDEVKAKAKAIRERKFAKDWADWAKTGKRTHKQNSKYNKYLGLVYANAAGATFPEARIQALLNSAIKG